MTNKAAQVVNDTPAPAGRWRTLQPWVSLVIRVGLAIVFLWSGIAKIIDIPQSQIAVRGFQILPEAVVPLVGIALPIFELIVALLLLTGLLTRLSAIGFAAVMVAFVIGIAAAWARGISIDCGCFGGGGAVSGDQSVTYAWEIARDVGLAACAVVLAIWPWSPYSADRALGIEPVRRTEA